MKRKRLGEVLRERGHISHADLAKAIEEQEGKLVHLGELLLDRGLVSRPDLAAALTEVTRVPCVDCETALVDPEMLKLLPHAMAKRWCALPIQKEGRAKLIVAMAEPQNLQAIDELRFLTGLGIVPRLGFRNEILAAIEKWYGAGEEEPAEEVVAPEGHDSGLELISSSAMQRNTEAVQQVREELRHLNSPAVRLVATAISSAITKQASDIHIEPQAADTVIRMRIDGMLRDYQRIPRSLQNSVVSRIKILADMDIAERRTPQDGRFLVKVSGKKLDLRVSTLPTQHGEKVVMRLLESDAPLRSFAALGIPPEISDWLQQILTGPQGMVLVTGPTGSGKSTTLYSSMNVIRTLPLNIVTVEDPVEYAIPGLNQVQVNTKAGLTFGNCLRSILRQDPNVILVGEIRDAETAEIAMKVAQTGHLVLSTLHTNDSVSAIARLVDLGMPRFQIAASLSCIIAQRLLRRLCVCSEKIPASSEYRVKLAHAGLQTPPEVQYIPAGCEICDMTGYKGRIGIYEMLVFSDA
ncbi:MAG TPA: ATPase, T2SS/T4P/T4SS family, partial [Bryobacteraceae bacterium]|nr:ATPase, T2SS/T4P/T4SS family [Bryobacteraceae bacterium]